MSLQWTVRGINEFKKGYQPRSNLVKDENGDLLADSHNILNRWKNYYSHLLNVHRFSDVRQIEVHTAEYLVPALLRLKLLLQSWKGPNRQVVMKFKQEVKYYVLRSISLLILFGYYSPQYFVLECLYSLDVALTGTTPQLYSISPDRFYLEWGRIAWSVEGVYYCTSSQEGW
jgi:hypothetical protein